MKVHFYPPSEYCDEENATTASQYASLRNIHIFHFISTIIYQVSETGLGP